MRLPDQLRLPAKCFKYLALSLVVLLPACRSSQDTDSFQPVSKGTIELKIDATDGTAVGAVPRFVVQKRQVSPTTLTLTLRWPAAKTPANPKVSLALCLPPNRAVTARWTKAMLNGKAVRIGKDQTPAVTEKTKSPDPARAAAPAPAIPSAHAGRVEFVGHLRQWPIYRLTIAPETFYPLRDYNSSQGTERTSPPDKGEFELTLELGWKNPWPPVKATTNTTPGLQSWRRIAEALVLDPASLDDYANPTPPLPNGVTVKSTNPLDLWPGSRPWTQFQIEKDGLVRLDRDELIKAGFAPSQLKLEDIRVFTHGQPVPLLLAPSDSAPAGMKPGIYFWARGGEGPYTRARNYWITQAADLPAVRLALADLKTTPAAARHVPTIRRTSTLDEDSTFAKRQDQFQTILGMDWVDRELSEAAPMNLGLRLPHFVPSGRQLEVKLEFFFENGRGSIQQDLEARAGGKLIDTWSLRLPTQYVHTTSLPESAVHDNGTTVSLTLIPLKTALQDEPQGGIWFNKATVAYEAEPRLIDERLTLAADGLTSGVLWTPLPDLDGATTRTLIGVRISPTDEALDLLAPSVDEQGNHGILWTGGKKNRVEILDTGAISDAPALKAVGLRDLFKAGPADLLVITHREFADHAKTLADFHTGQGWKSRVVDIQDVYNTYSHGELSPEAIRSFLADTLQRWGLNAPGAVILFGDATNDFLDVAHCQREGLVTNFVPSYTATEGGDSMASDYWLSLAVGEDKLGDFMIGRLSVANRENAKTVVDKLIAYATKPRPGPWRARQGFVWDDDNGEFARVLDYLRREKTPPAFAHEITALEKMPIEDNWWIPKKDADREKSKVSRAATESILKAHKKGVALMTYYGHGSPNIWGDERIWFGGESKNSDNLFLAGNGYQTFIVNMTCNTGAFDYPLPPWNICITEDMIRVPDGGAIACYVPSGPGTTSIHQAMSENLGRVLYDDKLRQFGELVTLTRIRYAFDQQPAGLLYMYQFLGDPLLNLQMTANFHEFAWPESSLAPGTEIKQEVRGILPEAGQWMAQLADAQGQVLWSSEPAAYQRGRLTLDFKLPENLHEGLADIANANAGGAASPGANPGKAQLWLYCWDPESGADLAVGAAIPIESPRLELHPLRLAAKGNPAAHVAIPIKNPLATECAAKLEVWTQDATSTHSLLNRYVNVAPQKEEIVEVKVPKLKTAAIVQTRLTLPLAPDDPALPRVQTASLPFVPEGAKPALFAPLCQMRQPIGNPMGTTDLTITAAVEPARIYAVMLQSREGVELTTQPLVRGDIPRTGHATVRLDSALDAKLKGGTLWLVSLTTPTRALQERVDSLPLDKVNRPAPRLRIKPGSLRHRPEKPSDGETIFVDFTVENAGGAISETANVGLYDHPLAQGGKRLHSQMDYALHPVPRLAAGRSLPVTLRWDPFQNFGCQTVYVNLMSEMGAQQKPTTDTQQTVRIKVLTKAKLEFGRAWTSPSEADLRARRLPLNAEIRNAGETDAHHVMVSFFRSREQTPENVIGEVELDKVPGQGSAVASTVWEDFDPQRDIPIGAKAPHPTVQIWLKGSRQRVSSLDAQ